MKLICTVLGLILVGGVFYIKSTKSDFSVGTCVRELGHDTIEKVIATTNGGIETEYELSYNPGKFTRDVYTLEKQELLISVPCNKE